MKHSLSPRLRSPRCTKCVVVVVVVAGVGVEWAKGQGRNARRRPLPGSGRGERRGEDRGGAVCTAQSSARRSRSRWRQRSRLATPASFTAPGSAMILAAGRRRAPDLLWRGLAEASSTVTATTAVHGAPILAVFAHALLVLSRRLVRRILAKPRPYVPRRTPSALHLERLHFTLHAPSAAILLSLAAAAARLSLRQISVQPALSKQCSSPH